MPTGPTLMLPANRCLYACDGEKSGGEPLAAQRDYLACRVIDFIA